MKYNFEEYNNIDNKNSMDVKIDEKKENSIEVSSEAYDNNNEFGLSNTLGSKSQKKKKKHKIIISPNSSKYIIFLVTLWIIAFLSFIIGFILQYAVGVGIIAASVLWTFSLIICAIASVFTYLYKKSRDEEDINEKIKLLRYFPIS